MKIVIDDKIPFIKGVFEPQAEVIYSTAISADMVRDADALITRTRTKCNSALLEGSSVKMIATATRITSYNVCYTKLLRRKL